MSLFPNKKDSPLNVREWGTGATSITAIIALAVMIFSQVWPWCVSMGLGNRDEALRENTKAIKELTKEVSDLKGLLNATIETTGKRVHEGDLRAERLRGSVEALRNEVRLRHGVSRSDDVVQFLISTSENPIHRQASSSASIYRKLSKQQQVRAIVRRADESLKEAKKLPVPDMSLEDQIEAKLK